MSDPAAPRLLLVTGLSGAGKSTVLKVLEDLGWEVVDNLPLALLDALIDAINASGYGLTLGVHTRIDGVAAHVAARAAVGNVYVNRNQIGAIVGSQPFGGRGLSGTGPKAGGPHYLHRFAEEKSISTDITAAGGNAALMAG